MSYYCHNIIIELLLLISIYLEEDYMKKYIILEIICVPIFVLAMLIPIFMESFVPTVRITKIAKTKYSEDIFVNGFVEEASKKDVYVELPIVPSEINFRIGDKIKSGDVIASVDTQATQKALFAMAEMTQLIPDEYVEALGQIRVSDDLVKGYVPTEIRSPTSGTISSISLVEGAISMPKSSVVTIIQADDVLVRMTVNESDIDRVSVGDDVVFKASATDNIKYHGKVERLFPTATKTLIGTSQVTVVDLYVKLSEKYERLRPGYTVNGVVKRPASDEIYVLPYEAVCQDKDNKEFVYLVSGSFSQKCFVKTGRELENGIEIISPQLHGQKVILNSTDVKKNNMLVHIVGN